MGRCCYVLLTRRHDVLIKRRGDVPLRRVGDAPSRWRWVFHLRRTCNFAGTYRDTSLQRHHNVSLPDGISLYLFIGKTNNKYIKNYNKN